MIDEEKDPDAPDAEDEDESHDVVRLKDLSDHEYLFTVEDGEDEVVVCRTSDRSHHRIGPLATCYLGGSEIDEENGEVKTLDGEDACILYTVASIPAIARLLNWIVFKTDHKAATTDDAFKFIAELRKKTVLIIDGIDSRGGMEELHAGEWGISGAKDRT